MVRSFGFGSGAGGAPLTRRWVLGGAARLGASATATGLAACSVPGRGTPPASKTLQGSVEFWTHPGLAYKDQVGAQLASEFEAKHPGVKINWTDRQPNIPALIAAVAAGSAPDIAYADRFNTKSLACKSVASSVDEYLKRSPIKPDNIWPLMREQVTYKGKMYAMPHQGNCGLLHYNKNHFREAGLNPDRPPATWDEMLQTIPRLTRRSGGTLERAGWVPTRGFGVAWMVPFWQLGGELLDKDEQKVLFNNQIGVQTFDWLLRIHDLQGGEDAIAPLYAGVNAFDAFSQGKVAIVWANNTQWRTTFSKVANLDVGVTYWPTPPNSRRSNYMGGWSLIIPNGARNPDAAFGYLEFKLGDEQQLRWSDQFESIPSVRSAATSERYFSGRPERRLAVADAPVARFVIGAPGGDTALAYQSAVANTILQRRMTVQDALNDAAQKVQHELDEARRNCSI